MRRASSSARRFRWLPTRAPVTRRSRPASAWAARPCTGPSAALSSATWRPRSVKSRVLERAASSRAKRKPCWSRRPVRAHLRAAPVGPWSCWSDELVRLTEHDSISRETVRRRLAENDLKPWRKDMWCIPQVDGEYVARMEDVLDLYAEPPDPKRPIVCFDESPTQLIGEVRQPIPAKPGQLERYDCEYKRNGTANLFFFLDVHRPWRKVKVTVSRTAVDFAICMRELTDVDYPGAERIRVVVDNLSTHSAGALYQAFPACEARRVLRRLEFHYVPKHASWLNMVEIEIGVLHSQCLDRRLGTQERLVSEITAWERQRNASGARIKWMFTTPESPH